MIPLFSGKRILIAISLVFSMVLFLLGLFININTANQTIHLHLPWIQASFQKISISLILDSTSRSMAILVPLVGGIVQFYAYSYLKKDLNQGYFFGLINAFIGSMLLLSLSDQTILFYGAWELVGLFSYLLIGFWRENPKANRAASKAFLINRVADFCLILGLILSIQYFNTFEFSKMNIALFGPLPNKTALLLILGAAGKSAQFPFSSWLPDAMQGPTPASALIHAATMVTAGLILGIKIIPLISEEMKIIFAAIGLISFIMGAILALYQKDLKKILAYSTISQIGFMWIGLGSDASLAHLLSHGIFKAGLFLTAGIIIHENEKRKILDANNIYFMPPLRKTNPLLWIFFLIFSFNLIGLPGTISFHSKELILANLGNIALINSTFNLYFYFTFIGLIISNTYTIKLLIQLGFNQLEFKIKDNKLNLMEYIPVGILAISSLFIFTGWNPMEINHVFLNNWFGINNIPSEKTILPLVSISWIFGLGLAYILRNWQPRPIRFGGELIWTRLWKTLVIVSKIFHQGMEYWLDLLIQYLGKISVIIGHLIHWIDNHFVDLILVRLNGYIQLKISGAFISIQKGNYRTYLISFIVTFFLLFLYLILF